MRVNQAPLSISDEKFKRLKIENIDRAPRKPGVYALYEDRTLIFLGKASGKADTIRSRLRSHLGALPQGATRYKRELASDPEARLASLLAEYTAANGGPPRGNSPAPRKKK